MAKKGQKFNKYERDFILKVTLEKINGELSYKELGEKYKIKEKTIAVLVYKYNKGWDFTDRRGKPKCDEINYKERYEILKKFQAFLKQR
jgi:transposase